MMGPLAGVMVSDYYLIKKKKLNIHELYKDHGIYWYSGGWNWRAYAAFFIGFAPLIPGFAKSIDNSLNVGGAWTIYTFACLYGFTFSLLSYYVITKYISPIPEACIDVAVYPPKRGDIESRESTDYYEGKDEIITKSKEVDSPV